MDHIGLDHQVLIDELGRVAIIRPDPADLGRGEIDPCRPLGREAGIDRRDIGEVATKGSRLPCNAIDCARVEPNVLSVGRGLPRNAIMDRPATYGPGAVVRVKCNSSRRIAF